jgi:hypothetical protein
MGSARRLSNRRTCLPLLRGTASSACSRTTRDSSGLPYSERKLKPQKAAKGCNQSAGIIIGACAINLQESSLQIQLHATRICRNRHFKFNFNCTSNSTHATRIACSRNLHKTHIYTYTHTCGSPVARAEQVVHTLAHLHTPTHLHVHTLALILSGRPVVRTLPERSPPSRTNCCIAPQC